MYECDPVDYIMTITKIETNELDLGILKGFLIDEIFLTVKQT